MTLLAEFTLPASDFPLGAVFESHPQARFELDRVIPAGDTFMPYFWVEDDDMEPIRARLADLTALRTVTLLEDLGDKGLFRAEWEPEYGGIMHAVAESGAVVVSATGTAQGWTFELRAEDAETFTRFREVCESRDVDVELARFHRLSRTTTGDEYDLTAEQREALALAYEQGYYDDPRGTDLETLAETLDISRPAFSARLRRGYRNLVGNALDLGKRDQS